MRPFYNFFSRKQNWLGLILVLFFVAIAITAPRLSPQTPSDQGYFKRVGHFADMAPHPPGGAARFGTLPGQFDVFHTLVWGTRNALQYGLLVALVSAIIGIIFGAVSGYAGGIVNRLMMRFSDAFLAFPIIAGIVFLQQLFTVAVESNSGIPSLHIPFISAPNSTGVAGATLSVNNLLNLIDPLMLSLIIFSWMPYARMVNSMVLGLKNMEFIQAARALGASPARIVLRHLIPNSISPAIVLAARDVGSVVLLQATLTFIQIGGNSPWGELLARGRNFILGPGGSLQTYWWVYVPATLTVILFGVSWNLLGDGVNDALNPKFISQNESQWHVRRKRYSKSKTEQNIEIVLAQKELGPDPVLGFAREAMESREMENALHSYHHLIRHDRELENVILDLVQFLRQSPGETQFWRTLGDALLHIGQIQDAERAYAQAKKTAHEFYDNPAD